MNILNNSYTEALKENENVEVYYENYKRAHDNLISDLKTFSDSLEPSILVPICNRVLIKGKLIHTNEIMVSLGCGYFTKCTASEAQQICLRRIKRVDSILSEFKKEKEFLTNQIKFSKDNIFSTGCEEIIEPYIEDVEEEWRKQHAKLTKEYRLKENQERKNVDSSEFISKLELLELQEEIEELHSIEEAKSNKLFTNADENSRKEANNEDQALIENKLESMCLEEIAEQPPVQKEKPHTKAKEASKIGSEKDIGNSREFALRKKLADLRQRKKNKCVTEEDIFKRLEELEEEEKIEDELDRLYDNIYEDKVETDSEHTSVEDLFVDDYYESESSTDDERKQPAKKIVKAPASTKKVYFLSKDSEAQTTTINFKHSENPIPENRQSETLISPSDIYKHFPQNFKKESKSILKNKHRVEEEERETTSIELPEEKKVTQNIVLGNIVEHSTKDIHPDREDTVQKKPISKFKSMRSGNKKNT